MKSKNLMSNFHFLIVIVIALLISVFSFLILRAFHWRLDLSKGKVYSLSSQTIQLLNQYQSEPIRVWAFFADGQPFQAQLDDLLKEYSNHHKDFYYQIYDPDRNPGKAKEYKVDSYGTIVIETKGRTEKTKQVSEQAITDILGRLLRDESKHVAFATGHGGPSVKVVKEKIGYGLLANELKNSRYEVREVILSRDQKLEGTDLLALAGPRVDLLPDEFKVVEDYLAGGGSVLIMADPVQAGEGKNLHDFLLNYGIKLGNNVIVDKVSKLFGADYLIPLVTDYQEHAITRGFQLASFFPLARTVGKAEKVPANLEVTELAMTGAGSWAETDLAKLAEGTAEFEETKDAPGPVPIVTAVQNQKNKSRLVVIGDSDFATNAYVNLSGNKDLILNVISWLLADELSISIRPRTREITPLYLKESDQHFLFYGPVLGLPILSLGFGTGIFFRRRKYN